MAALDFMVSVASNTFIPSYDGKMAKLVEDRKRLVELIDIYENKTLSWDEFSVAVQVTHEGRMGQPTQRREIPDRPKEEDYFYANPHECFCHKTSCDDLLGGCSHKSTEEAIS
ncbi:hypothetical protein LguiA_033956 [Lonicera macranthoides]